MLDAAVDTLKTSDMILWVVEPSTFIGKGERYIAELIGKAVKSLRKKNSDSENVVCPVMLVINKIDSCQDDSLIEKTLETYGSYVRDTEGFEFDHVCKVSATAGTGLDDMMSDIYDFLPEGPMYFDEEAITDETERDIAAEFIREKCLRNLDKEIPHGIAVIVDKMRERADGSLVDIEATIICERESHKGIIIGKNGAMLKRIGTQARHDIEDMLQQRVNLKLWVKVRPGWRDKKMYMDEYGFK